MAPVVGLTLVVPWLAEPTTATVVGLIVPSGSLSLLKTLMTTAVSLFVVTPGSLLATGGAFTGVMESVSVAVLLLVLISVVPAGGLTVAVLLSEPVAVGLTVPVTRYVTLLPTGRLTS